MPSTAPVSALGPVPVQGEARVPLASFIRPFQRHYFSGTPERPNYRARSYDFAGTPAVMPLVRAFLDTCAATPWRAPPAWSVSTPSADSAAPRTCHAWADTAPSTPANTSRPRSSKPTTVT